MSHQNNQKSTHSAADTDIEIVEGEIMEESIDDKIARGRAYSSAKSDSKTGDAQTSSSSYFGTEGNPSAFGAGAVQETTGIWARYRKVLLGLAMGIAIVLTLVLTRPDTDWQIQHINNLQSEVAKLNEKSKALEARLAAQETAQEKRVKTLVAKMMVNPDYQPAVSQADLKAIKAASESQIKQVKEALTALNEKANLQFESAIEKLQALALDRNDSLEIQTAPTLIGEVSDVQNEGLQSKIGAMKSQLADLFDFKAQQQLKALQQPTLSSNEALSSFEIQKWIVQINTQWMLHGNASETLQQLIALEQAIGLSQFAYISTLGRLIGEDIAYLKQYIEQSRLHENLDTVVLKSAISELHLSVLTPPETPSSEKTSALSTGEVLDTESAFEKLKSRLSQMIRVTKRETDTEATQVELMLMEDVLKQRAALLVDRVDWAIQTQSQGLLLAATADLQAFISKKFPEAAAEYEALLAPYKTIQFHKPKPLNIMGLEG
ncbi:MAG: hypothetical protein GXO35_00840 [Gammaproteobacteria bacterium]|nr:hypothetical protein [Gammaproteobacteria bacterium]